MRQKRERGQGGVFNARDLDMLLFAVMPQGQLPCKSKMIISDGLVNRTLRERSLR